MLGRVLLYILFLLVADRQAWGAQPISMNVPVTGHISTPFHQDQFKIQITAGRRLLLHRPAEYSDFVIALKSPLTSAVLLNTATNTGPKYSLISGTYTVTVAATNGTVGDYVFELLDFADAQELSSGRAVHGSMAGVDSIAVFQFDAVAGQRFDFQFSSVRRELLIQVHFV